jgi:hypothetical protein
MSNISKIVEFFKSRPYAIRMGAGKLSKHLHCKREDIYKARELYRSSCISKRPVKVLIFDVETAPLSAYIWRIWKETISWDMVHREWFFLCWSAKWLYSNDVMSDVLSPEEALSEDDSRIVKSLWHLIDEADIVVAHNAKKADVPWMNTRFILNGLVPPSSYKVIDTLDIAKRQFRFSSNKLDALAGYFGIGHKIKTSFALWEGCMKGDAESLREMQRYNIMDVKILEEVYLKLRPWCLSHPNMNNLQDSAVLSCCKCGSSGLVVEEGKYYYTTTQKYKLYRCTDCGALTRSRYPEPREVIRSVGVNV